MQRLRSNWFRHGAVMLACALLAVSLYNFVRADPPEPTPPPVWAETPTVVFDPPSGAVSTAKIEARLVQAGTDQPFRGDGLPGLRLTVRGGGDLSRWTVEGWANQTTPNGASICASRTIHYLRYDWAYQTDDATNEGIFTTIPSTVPQRVLPDGDQCSPRVGATGEWTISYRIEGKEGGPRGIVRDKDGKTILDDWDKHESLTVQVTA